MNLNDFNYELPKELIAHKPASPRSASKIFIAEKKKISYFFKLHEYLDSNDVLIINNTKVIPAIIYGKINNKTIKITLHTKISKNSWIAFAKPARIIKEGKKYANTSSRSSGAWFGTFSLDRPSSLHIIRDISRSSFG